MNRAFLGAGISCRPRYTAALIRAADDPLRESERPSVLEIIPDHFATRLDTLSQLSAHYPTVFHDVGLSIGTLSGTEETRKVNRARMDRVKKLMDCARPLLFTEHLAMTHSPSGIDLGHLAPIWYTNRMLERTSDHVRAWQDAFGVPIALENIAAPFTLPEADLTEPEFFTQLVERTGCGLLLDVSNQLVNARNQGVDPAESLNGYPLSAVWGVHLAGGYKNRGVWVDSHDREVEEASFALLLQVSKRARDLLTVIIERDEQLPELHQLVAEARKAEQVVRS
ncbi:MAG TPA: DUF692 domain-containing protein [Polyangiaceae bacterium]|jgi:hypothetical protein